MQAQVDEILRLIMQGTASSTGGAFFRALVQNLARAMKMKYAFIAELVDCRDQAACASARTLAFWADQDFQDNVEYALAGTPCERVIDGNTLLIREKAEALFPADIHLIGEAFEFGIFCFEFFDQALLLGLGALAVGDVTDQGENQRPVVGLNQPDTHLYRKRTPVFASMHPPQGHRHSPLHLSPDLLQRARPKVDFYIVHVHLKQFFAGIAKAVAGALVDVKDLAVRVMENESIGSMFDQVPHPRFIFA